MSEPHPHKIREFSGVPWLYSALNSGGAILQHIQFIISLAYLCQVNFNIDAMLILYLIRLTIDNNNQVDLFPNETVLNVNTNLHFLSLQISRLSYDDEISVSNSRYVDNVLYFGPYLKKECDYFSEICVLNALHYNHLIVAFPGVNSSSSLTVELRSVFSGYTIDLTKYTGLSGLTDTSGNIISNVYVTRSFVPYVTSLSENENCVDATENTSLLQYVTNQTECLFTGHSSGAAKSLFNAIIYAGKFPNITFKVYAFCLLKCYSNNISDLIDALPNLEVYIFNDTRDPIVGSFNILQMTNCDRYSPLYEDDPLTVLSYQNENGITSTTHDTNNTFNIFNLSTHLPHNIATIMSQYNSTSGCASSPVTITVESEFISPGNSVYKYITSDSNGNGGLFGCINAIRGSTLTIYAVGDYADLVSHPIIITEFNDQGQQATPMSNVVKTDTGGQNNDGTYTLTWVVPSDTSVDKYQYQCENHAHMRGTINVG